MIGLILWIHATQTMNARHVDCSEIDTAVFTTGCTILIDRQFDCCRSLVFVMADDFQLQETAGEQVASIRFRTGTVQQVANIQHVGIGVGRLIAQVEIGDMVAMDDTVQIALMILEDIVTGPSGQNVIALASGENIVT